MQLFQKIKRIFTSFMKELAKKEARGYWTVLFITILFVLFP